MILINPTIMHTGTHVIRRSVLRNFIPVIVGEDVVKHAGLYVYICHLVDSRMGALLPLLDKHPVVMPMRHPARVLASFESRGVSFEHYIEQWHNLSVVMNIAPVKFIHIDSEDRDEQAMSLAREYNFNYRPDWDIKKEYGCVRGNHDIELIDDICSKVPTDVMNIYEKTRNL